MSDEEDDLKAWRIEIEVIANDERAEQIHATILNAIEEEELESLTRFSMDDWTRIEKEYEDDEESDGHDHGEDDADADAVAEEE